MGDTLQWVPRAEDNEWNNQCEYLAQHGYGKIGVVWYSIRDYSEEGVGDKYKKNQWYYASIVDDNDNTYEAANREEAKALCIMLCKLNQ